MPCITLDNVCYQYKTDDVPQVALDHASLSIDEGQFVVLLGANGSGKSTLAKLLNGLLVPSSGKVTVFGDDTASEEDEVIYRIRSTVGMVFQNPDNQMVASIIEDDIAFGPENLGIPREEIAERVRWALEAVGMWEYRTHTPERLSGGQKQRIAIAGILAMKPKVLVLDESTAMLDPRGRREVLSVLRDLNRQGLTVILITHHMDECIGADRAVVLHEGKVVFDDKPPVLFADEQLAPRWGLELPSVARLSLALPTLGLAPLDDPCDEEGLLNALLTLPPKQADPSRHFEAGEDPVVEMGHLGYTYSPKTPYQFTALSDVSMTLNRGQMIAVVGETGSGKSTLMQHLNGLIKKQSGTLRVLDCDMDHRPNYKKLRFRVGMVFQYPEYQLFDETVAKDVGFGPRNAKVPKEEIEGLVCDALANVGLRYDLVKDRSPFELSGGQKRRVALAGVLAMRPEVLILDEPTAGLDPIGKQTILRLVDEWHHSVCPTVLMVSHDMEMVARYADRVLVMSGGKLLYDVTPYELFAKGEELSDLGLEVPLTARLSLALNAHGWSIPVALTVEELLGYLKEAQDA